MYKSHMIKKNKSSWRVYALAKGIHGFGIQRYYGYWCFTFWNKVFTNEPE